MPSRPLEIAAFLNRHGWDCAEMQSQSGDFSTRRYARLVQKTGETAFLMDADSDSNTPSFVRVAEILRRTGIRSPRIFAAEETRGLVLMEDLGDRNMGAMLDAEEDPLPDFPRAAELLARLHRNFDGDAEGFPVFDSVLFTAQVELFLDYYFPVAAQREASEDEREEFTEAWRTVLKPLDSFPRSLMLRDFMPDNLMKLPDGDLAVLDFQDAGIGPIAYDLASLCEEVRRDGGFAHLPDVIDRYRAQAAAPPPRDDLVRACTVLSAQRHMRVLGIIVRLSQASGQCDKFAYMPRIRNHIRNTLNEPALFPVKAWIETFDGLLE